MRYRRQIFYLFLFLFPIIGALTTAYSLGWRINWDTWKIEKVGGISIKTSPRDVVIKINNEIYPDKSGFLQSETVITNLLPKTYHVQISKEGYYPYYKELKVDPGMVSGLLSVWLIPEKIKFQEVVKTRGEKIADISPDGSRFITYNAAKNIFYLYSTDSPEQTTNLTALLGNVKKLPSLKKIVFVPNQPDNFLFEDGKFLKIYSNEDKKIDVINSAPIIAWSISDNEIYYLAASSSSAAPTLYSFDLTRQSTAEIKEIGEQKNIVPLKMEISPDKKLLGVLDDENNFYLLSLSSPENNFLNKIPEKISLTRDFDFSPDGKKLAVLNKNNSLDIFYLEDFDWETRKKAGDMSKINLEEKRAVDKILWDNDSLHIFYASEKENGTIIKVAEINEGRPVNIYKIAENFSDWFYQKNSGVFFLLQNNVLNKIIW